MGFWIFIAIIVLLCFSTVIEVLLMLFSSNNACNYRRDKPHWMRSAMDDHR